MDYSEKECDFFGGKSTDHKGDIHERFFGDDYWYDLKTTPEENGQIFTKVDFRNKMLDLKTFCDDSNHDIHELYYEVVNKKEIKISKIEIFNREGITEQQKQDIIDYLKNKGWKVTDGYFEEKACVVGHDGTLIPSQKDRIILVIT